MITNQRPDPITFRLFAGGECENKKCLILVSERYKYQAVISDLSNSDVANHQNTPEDVVVEIRNWLSFTCGLKADGPSKILDSFNIFMGDNYDALIDRGFSKRDIERLPVLELMHDMEKWVEDNV